MGNSEVGLEIIGSGESIGLITSTPMPPGFFPPPQPERYLLPPGLR